MPPAQPIVIAHRGASGYLPEHTLPAKAYAHAVGADFLEQDVVLTRDDVPIVLHDIHLDTVSDVAQKFPGRQREDGRFYAIDFTWDEVRQLRASERFKAPTGQAVYPARFPVGQSHFTIPSLEEELTFIAGLNASTGRTAGIYPEIKQPAFHRQAGKDISRIVLKAIVRTGWATDKNLVYVQCFEAPETRRIREELGCQLPIIQLLAGDPWDDFVKPGRLNDLTDALKQVREYADGIGPSLPQLLLGRDPDGFLRTSPLVEAAHQVGLKVHPWTIRRDALPKEVDSLDSLHEVLFSRLGVDGAFSDFPDLTVQYVRGLNLG
jgi:glycerophosphoryl diester phosphodiesterase